MELYDLHAESASRGRIQKAIEDAGISADDIDLILCISDEWKEHPLTTSAMVVQDYIGAKNGWDIDVQNRCSTTISAMKMAKDMILGIDDIETVLIACGYRNGDLIDYSERDSSMFFDLSAGLVVSQMRCLAHCMVKKI